jgi:hypothetical protein
MHLLTARYATIWLFWLMGAGLSFAQNPYYDHGTFPATGTLGTSAGMRAELDSIEAGFSKLPTLSGNADKTVRVNAAGTALVASDSPVMSGATFPSSPSVNALFLVTDDSTAGECDSGGGVETTLCRWDGSNWVPIVGSSAAQGLTAVLAVDRIDGDAVNLASALRIGSAAANAYMVTYYDSTDGLIHTCLIGGVLDDCNKRVKLVTGKKFFIANNAGTEIFTVSESGAITNATIDGEGSGNTITLTEEQWYNVVSCQNTTPFHIHDTPTTNIPEAICDTGTNTQKGYAAFDATTDESIHGHWVLPIGFTGGIDIKGKYKIAATSGAVGWCFQMIRVADGSTSDPAFPAQAAGNCTSDTVKGTTLQENDFTITGATCTSCVAGDHVYWRLSRDANGGAVTDDAAGDGFLLTFGRVWRVAH